MDFCDQTSPSPLQTLSSNRRRRCPTQTWPCAICHFLFSSSGDLDNHAIKTKHKAFCCTRADCQKLFGRRTALARHRSSHLDIKGHRCTICAKSFHRKDHCHDHEQLCGRKSRKRQSRGASRKRAGTNELSSTIAVQSVGDITTYGCDATASKERKDEVEVFSRPQLFTSEANLLRMASPEERSGLDNPDGCATTCNGTTHNIPSDPSRTYKDVGVTFESVEDRDHFLQLLLESGEDVHATDEDAEDGRTPLHVAAESGIAFAIEPLIEYGASLNKQDYFACTPLFLAARGGYLKVAAALLRHGAYPNIPNKLGDTPLHTAVRYGHIDMVKLLLSYGANANATNHNYSTPLHWAASFNRWDVMTRLIEHGASVGVTDCDGDTPLHLAADFGAVAAVTKLAGSGSNLDAKNVAGQTALHRAALGGYAETFVLLLSVGANEQAMDNHGHTPLDYNKVRGRLAEAISDRTLEVSWADDPELFGTEAIVKTTHGSTSQSLYTSRSRSLVKHDPDCPQPATLHRVCWCGERDPQLAASPTKQPILWLDSTMCPSSEYCSLSWHISPSYNTLPGLVSSLSAHVGCRGTSELLRPPGTLSATRGPSFALVSV